MRRWGGVTLVVGLLLASPASAWAKCASTVSSGGLSAYLIGTKTLTEWRGVLSGDWLIVYAVDTEIGLYRLDDGSTVELQCGQTVRL